MVSIKRNLGLFFIRSLVFVSFMGLCCAAYAAVCTGSQVACCKGTTMSCCPHPGYDSNGVELSYDLRACMTLTPILPDDPIIIGPIDPIETCTSGAVQYKPSGTCGTSSRTCCSSGSWSGWDAACPKTCDGTKPITSRSCGTNGTQTRSVTCDTSTGKWVEGAWGTCKEQVCTPGEVGPCPTNCYQRRTCNADGTAWSSCACENNDEIWRITMTYQNVTQSSNTCEAHCCCSGDTPVSNVYNKYLGKNLGTGCLGENGTYEYYCACQEKGSSSPSSGYTGTQSQCLR